MIDAPAEQFADVGRGISLCYEVLGDPEAPALLLIAGLGQQLISWPRPLCDALADKGFRVIRFDNRDVGKSTHLYSKPPGLIALLARRFPSGQYRLKDMAADTHGLLDALAIDTAHIVGASMGGMIAQTVAARFPDRVRSLTSMMSTTGASRVGQPALSTWLKLGMSPAATAAEAVKADLRVFRHIGSPGFEFDAAWVAAQAEAAWKRDPTVDGVSRQLGAIYASGDRTPDLAQISAPTLVIHGDRDRMVATSGGLATHDAISHSTLWVVPGMGHDYPRDLWPQLVERIAAHAWLADSSADQPAAKKCAVERRDESSEQK